MRRLLFYTICSVAMFGVYLLIKFAVTGISADFGLGFFAGIMTLAVLFWLVDRFTEGGLGGR
jgi:hypothetical protein